MGKKFGQNSGNSFDRHHDLIFLISKLESLMTKLKLCAVDTWTKNVTYKGRPKSFQLWHVIRQQHFSQLIHQWNAHSLL